MQRHTASLLSARLLAIVTFSLFACDGDPPASVTPDAAPDAPLREDAGSDAPPLQDIATEDAPTVEDAPPGQDAGSDVPAGTDAPADAVIVPELRAPPVDQGAPTEVYRATRFLYTGANPVQRGVAPTTIVPRRAAVLRGIARTVGGVALPGVRVTVVDHPEYGETATRADGYFDMAVNGGADLVVRYEYSGRVTIERRVSPQWQSWVVAPDVTLTDVDRASVAVTASAMGLQAVRASRVTGPMDAHQATLVVRPNTRLSRSGGAGSSALTASTLHVTEVAARRSGAAALQSELPHFTAQAYAFEVTSEDAGGDAVVSFSQPAAVYLEDLLGFPSGMQVPMATYDRGRHAWQASAAGVVLRLLRVTGGVAELDTDGDGTADADEALSIFGISQDERRYLATTYTAGQTLWRMPVTRSGAWATQWGALPVSRRPDLSRGFTPVLDNPSVVQGSVIRVENLSLGESVAVAGTPFKLVYETSRALAGPAYATEFHVTPATLPEQLQRVIVETTIVGVRRTTEFPPIADQRFTFRWDGRDAWGREINGAQRLTVRVGYVYPSQYRQSRALNDYGAPPAMTAARAENIDWQTIGTTLGAPRARGTGLGGWSLDAHHVYDPTARALSRGDGVRRSAARRQTIRTVVGTGTMGFAGDGGPASAARLNRPRDVAVGPDGSLYIADSANHRIRAVGPDGIIRTIAGDGSAAYGGDGGPAVEASLHTPSGVAFDRRGNLYIADTENGQVRVVGTDGVIRRFAGTDRRGYAGDGGPALRAQLYDPTSVVVGPDDSVYIGDTSTHHIRRVAPDGTITAVAGDGGGLIRFPADPVLSGVLATQTAADAPTGLSFDADGSLFFTESRSLVRRIDPYGFTSVVAGRNYVMPAYTGDEGLAVAAGLGQLYDAEVARDGSLWIADTTNGRIRRVGTDGIIDTVAGGGSSLGDNGPARGAQLSYPAGMAFGPEGSLYIAEYTGHRIRQIAPGLPGFDETEHLLPSDDGTQIHVFDREGRHLRTLDAITSAVRLRFEYTPTGVLGALIDGDGNRTAIERDAGGRATAIVGPYGHRTALTVDASGNLTSVTDPASARTAFTYHGTGDLLATMTDARGGMHQYRYDAQGRLSEDVDPSGATVRLARTVGADGAETVRHTSGMGLVTTYSTRQDDTGALMQTTTAPSGLVTMTEHRPDGTMRRRDSDDTRTTAAPTGDPRFGLALPYLSAATVTTPAGLQMQASIARSNTLDMFTDPLSLSSDSETRIRNGQRSTRTTLVASRRTILRAPSGLQTQRRFDVQGRLTEVQPSGLFARQYIYDARGRVEVVVRDVRRMQQAYDARGNLERSTEPLGRVTNFSYDATGRLTRRILPGDHTEEMAYDPAGDLISITPPGRPAHTFTYEARGLRTLYSAPMVDGRAATTRYTYDSDRHVTRIDRADGVSVMYTYDRAGRRETITEPRGLTRFMYDATTGNLSRTSAPGGVDVSYIFDGSHRTRSSWSGPVTGAVSWAYDSDFHVISEQVEGGTGGTATWRYDQDGVMVQAGVLSINRDTTSGLPTTTTAGVVTTSQAFNGHGEVTNQQVRVRSTLVFERDYTRDALGRIIRVTETVDGMRSVHEYGYDVAGRLFGASREGVSLGQCTFDANGNRLRFTPPVGAAVVSTYDVRDRLITSGTTSYSYNAEGELTSVRDGTNTTTYTYDAFGHVTGATLPNGRRVEYLLDGEGRRVGRRVDGTLVQGWIYRDSLQPVAEIDRTGAVIVRFVYGTRPNVPELMVRGGATYRIVLDQLGSPRMVIDVTTGTVAQYMEYDPWGNVTLDTNPGFTPFGFAGGMWDRETNLVHFGAREYDPRTGRWTTKDPILFSGNESNLYRYASGDSQNYNDANGLEAAISYRALLTVIATAVLTHYGEKLWGAFDDWAWGIITSISGPPPANPPPPCGPGADFFACLPTGPF